MNLFLIPSWYPSEIFPINGIFCQEQAIATGELNSDWNVVISCWGQESYHLPFSQIYSWPKTLWVYLKNSCYQERVIKRNVIEYHFPLLHWNKRLISHETYFHWILEANRRHLKKAVRIYGKIDLIHAHVAYPGGVVANRLSDEFKIPYVITEHTGPFPPPLFVQEDYTLKQNIKNAYAHAKAVIGVSPYQVRRMEKAGIAATMVPNLVDEKRFRNISVIKKYEKDQDVVFFTLCSILSPEKGIDDLLHVIAKIYSELPLSKFRIGGNGNIKHYQALICSLGIQEKVTLLGQISRTQAALELNQCHAFVLPSHQESFGMVYIEALASGKPVIATRCGGGEFIVEEGQGIIIEPQQRNELASALVEMYHTSHTYCPETIRNKALKRFSKETVLSELTKVYRSSCVS